MTELSKLNEQFKHDKSRVAETEKVRRESRLLEIRAQLMVVLGATNMEAEMAEQATQGNASSFR